MTNIIGDICVYIIWDFSCTCTCCSDPPDLFMYMCIPN